MSPDGMRSATDSREHRGAHSFRLLDPRIKHYLERAAEVRRLAEATTHASIRTQLLAIVAQYEEMAANVERGGIGRFDG